MPALHPLRAVDFRPGRLYDTDDLDEARERCGRVFNPHTLQVLGPGQRLRASMDHLPLGPLSLNRLRWGAPVAVDPDRLSDYYLISIPVQGRARFELGGRETEVSPGCAGLVSAEPRFRFRASEGFDQIVLRLEASAVLAGWQALTGAPANRPIRFDCALPMSGRAWQSLQPVLTLLAEAAAGEHDTRALPHLTARAQEQLVTLLLLRQPHNLLPRSAERPAPRHLRQAEAYMLARLDTPLTLGEVALACGVARRTLQAAFQRTRGEGPMQWLRRQRLAAVHAALRGESGAGAGADACRDGAASVTQTALRFGFTHLGEFARAYRLAYGETPGQTRLRRR